MRAAFANHDYSDETFEQMDQLAKSGEAVKVSFGRARGELKNSVKKLIELQRQGFVMMQHPEQGFRCDEHLISPWKKLEAAKTHACFLRSCADTSFVLEAEMNILLETFRTTIADHVLLEYAHPHALIICML